MISVTSQFFVILFGAICLLLSGTVSAAQGKTLVPVYSLLLFDLKAGPNIQMVKDINPGVMDSEPEDLIAWNGLLYFGADDGVYGNEVWKSDGTETGTVMVKDIHEGPGSSDSFEYMNATIGWNRSFAVLGDYIYFAATSSNDWSALWKSDGTDAGTSEVFSVSPSDTTVLNGALYFRGFDGSDTELWKSNGTTTVMLKNISTFSSSYPGEGGGGSGFTQFNNELYFSVSNSDSETCHLWKTDGTSDGTVAVKPGTAIEPAGELAVCGSSLYFPVTVWVIDHNEYELWKSDGTPGGTTKLPGLNFTGSNPGRFTVYNGLLYFSANDGTHGWEIWKLDCTTGAAAMVKDISPDPAGDSPNNLTVFKGLLYFRATHPDYGDELWQTDGTEAGTTMVKDINPGAAGSSLDAFTVLNGMFYFTADDGEHGDELWQSDGTGTGTSLVKDINPGLDGSDPYYFTTVNGTLFFTATDGAAGYELWRLQP